MSRRTLEQQLMIWLVLPVVLIIVVFISFQVVQGLCNADPNFCDTGWKIFGVEVGAVCFFIGYIWLQELRSFFLKK
jgi:hypothetical protein